MGVAQTDARARARKAGTPAARRWLGVGHCPAGFGEEAGSRAAADALAGRRAKLLLVFASDGGDLPGLVASVREHCPDAALAGCTTAGEISGAGAGDGGVVVAALGGEGFEVHTAIGRPESGGLREAGAAAGAALGALEPNGRDHALMLLSDGVAGNQQDVIRGVHDVVGAGARLVGGCAGDGMKMNRTFQFRGDEVISGGVVGVAIASDGPLGLGWSHGWERAGEPMLVTSATGNRIDEIDDRPALDLYLEHFNAPDDVANDGRAFTSWARTHPLGLGQRPDGHQPVRCVSEADFGRRSIICTAEVPTGGLVWFMRGDGDSVLRSTAAACADALAPLGGEPPLGLLAFDCIGRRGVLGDDRIGEEVACIRAAGGSAPFAGLYTYGEIARAKGANALHSQTFVALAIG